MSKGICNQGVFLHKRNSSHEDDAAPLLISTVRLMPQYYNSVQYDIIVTFVFYELITMDVRNGFIECVRDNEKKKKQCNKIDTRDRS